MSNKNPSLNRLNYFHGQVLGIDEFKTEQIYFLEKLRRHNRYLHGWGVVNGFDVSVRATIVVVEPGVAIDCAGNEILLAEKMQCPIPKVIKECFVTAQFIETLVDPVPTINSPSEVSGSDQAYSRIEDGCQIEFADADTNTNHDDMGPGTSGCGSQHPITIAHLVKRKAGWTIIPMGRR
jgi:hypothetical protein